MRQKKRNFCNDVTYSAIQQSFVGRRNRRRHRRDASTPVRLVFVLISGRRRRMIWGPLYMTYTFL